MNIVIITITIINFGNKFIYRLFSPKAGGQQKGGAKITD